MSKFAHKSESVAEVLRGGLPIEVAAEQAGVSASTVRGWLRRGKREPDGEFGEFARAAEAPTEGDGAMSVEEVERHLTAVIRRSQSVAAMKLWLELHPEDREGVSDDPFAEFDAR